MPSPRTRLINLASCLLPMLLLGCGSGGGDGDDFVGAGEASIEVSPSKIDAGDRMQVTIRAGRIHPDGVALKVFFPRGLVYVPNSSELYIDDKPSKTDPAVNALASTGVYLVYYFAQKDFGKENRGVLVFELQGTDPVSGGRIGVDLDVDDPLVDNDIDFNINSPEFEAEDSVGVQVAG